MRPKAGRPADVAGGHRVGGRQRVSSVRTASGILYALEAEDLNLEGTELVVLSACDTALGQIDYGEGVSGLVRALRTAGARNVLVTLRPVDDERPRQFMQRFYFHWLSQPHSDPAAALRDAQLEPPTLARTQPGAASSSSETDLTVRRTISSSAPTPGVKRVRFCVAIVILGTVLAAHAATPMADQVSAWEALSRRVEGANEASDALPLAEQALALRELHRSARSSHTAQQE